MGCKNCKDKKNIISKIDDSNRGKFIFTLIGLTILVVPWIMGANQLFYLIKDFIISLL